MKIIVIVVFPRSELCLKLKYFSLSMKFDTSSQKDNLTESFNHKTLNFNGNRCFLSVKLVHITCAELHMITERQTITWHSGRLFQPAGHNLFQPAGHNLFKPVDDSLFKPVDDGLFQLADSAVITGN